MTPLNTNRSFLGETSYFLLGITAHFLGQGSNFLGIAQLFLKTRISLQSSILPEKLESYGKLEFSILGCFRIGLPIST